MSETCNRRQKCEYERYGEYKKCIFHCDKSEFEEYDIRQFWYKFNQVYKISGNRYHLEGDKELIGISFPSFNYNDFHNSILANLVFKKCIFHGDVDFSYKKLRNTVLFEECFFYGNLITTDANYIKMIDCEFKQAIADLHCNNLEVKNSKFINNVKFFVNIELKFIEAIFRKEFELHGTSNLESEMIETQFDKSISIYNLNTLTFNKINIKSVASFENCNEVNIPSILFPKDVVFDNVNNLKLLSCRFMKKLQFERTDTSIIELENIEVKNIELDSVNTLNITNASKILGSLIVKGTNQNILLAKSNITKKIEISNTKNLTCKEIKVSGQTNFLGNYNDVILESSKFEELNVSTTHTLKIVQSHIYKSCELVGIQYEEIYLQNSEFKELLEIHHTNLLELENIKAYQKLELKGEKYPKVDIKNSKLSEVELSSIVDLYITKTRLNGDVNFKGNEYEVIVFDNVITNKQCIFPSVEVHQLELTNSQIKYDVIFNGGQNFIFTKTKFKSKIEFLKQYNELKLDKCDITGMLNLNQHVSKIEFKMCVFNDNVNLSKSKISSLNIMSSNFNKSLNISHSQFSSLNFNRNINDEKQIVIGGLFDLTNIKCNDIWINRCMFKDEILIKNFENINGFSNIFDTTIKKLSISQGIIYQLFKDAKNLKINEMNLEDTKLTSHDSLEDIAIKNIEIEELVWNRVSTNKEMNLIDMKVGKFRISNCNFEHLLRIKFSDIEIINLISNTFEDLQIIENKNEKFEQKRELRLENTTIKNAVFDKLRYDKFILDKAHVSDAKIGNVEFKDGSRETNRFFKNYYDSISDYIQANSYYQKEMLEQYKVTKDKGEKTILFLGKWFSDFGQSWMRPIAWMIIFTIIFYRVANFDLFSIEGFRQKHISWMLNDILKFVNPFSKSASGIYGLFYWAWISHKIFMSVFIYHFIVAVKRKTRR